MSAPLIISSSRSNDDDKEEEEMKSRQESAAAAAQGDYDLELIDCCRSGNLRKFLEIKDSRNYSAQYLNSTSWRWETPLLHWSLLAPNIDVANYLITIGFDVNCKDKKYNMTPLQTSICHSSIRMVDLLMRSGAKLVGVSGQNPKSSELFLAKIHNKFATLAYLLENGADVGQVDANGDCFIHHLVQSTIDKSCLPLVSLYSPQVVEDCPRNSQQLTPQDLCLKNRRLSSLFQLRASGFPMRFSQNFKRSTVSKWFEDYFIRHNNPLQLATTYFTIFYICCIISFFTFKVSLMQSHPKYYITSLLIHSLTVLYLKALFRSKEMSVSEIYPLILTLNFLIYFLFDIRDSSSTFLSTLYHIDIAGLLFLIAFFLYSVPHHHLAHRNCCKLLPKDKKQFRDSVIRPKLQKLIKDPENHLTAEREFLKDICCYCLTTKKDAQHTFHCFICQRCVDASIGHSDYFNLCIDSRNVVCVCLNLLCVTLVAFGALLHYLRAIPIAFYNNYLHAGLWITIRSIANTLGIKNITFSIASLILLSQMPFWVAGINYRP